MVATHGKKHSESKGAIMFGLQSKKLNKKAKSGVAIAVALWCLVLVGVIWLVRAQKELLVPYNTVYAVDYLPKSLVGTKIAHISDMNNSTVSPIAELNKFRPDIILLSGGYIDSNGKCENTVAQVKEMVKIAPVYYVLNIGDKGIDVLKDTGAVNITNSYVEFKPNEVKLETFIKQNYGDELINKAKSSDKENEETKEAIEYLQYVSEQLKESADATIRVSGIDVYDYDYGSYDALEFMNKITDSGKADYEVALLGKMTMMKNLSNSQLDAIFTGGTFGTDKISTTYKKGKYNINGTEIFISGGISTPADVNRIFNFPEIQCITLSDGTISNENPIEKFLGLFIKDVGTIFDNDKGFTNSKTTYSNGNAKTN